jgi:hypothetical protein
VAAVANVIGQSFGGFVFRLNGDLDVAWDFNPVTLRLTWAVTITESAWTIAISAITARSAALAWGTITARSATLTWRSITAWWTRVSAVTALASSGTTARRSATAIAITSRSTIFTLFKAA